MYIFPERAGNRLIRFFSSDYDRAQRHAREGNKEKTFFFLWMIFFSDLVEILFLRFIWYPYSESKVSERWRLPSCLDLLFYRYNRAL